MHFIREKKKKRKRKREREKERLTNDQNSSEKLKVT